MKEKDKSISKSIKDAILTIGDSGLSLLIQVPPLQIGSAIKKVYSTVKEQFFIEKMELFLNTAQDVTQEEVASFLALLSTDQEEFFNRLWIITDRIEDKEKSAIIGRLFNALVRGHIKNGDFIKLTSIIDQTYIENLKFTKEISGKGSIENRWEEIREKHALENILSGSSDRSEIKKQLASVGLVSEQIRLETNLEKLVNPSIRVEYQLTSLGRILTKYGLASDGSK